jgi:hypothetical protein
MQDKITLLLFFTRLFTVASTILYIIPILGYAFINYNIFERSSIKLISFFSRFDINTLFSKALMASAATSALKLHQRMAGVPFQLNRAYLNQLMVEDSFHYLLFALVFMSNSPITIVLMPVNGFALLHCAAYVKTLINVI